MELWIDEDVKAVAAFMQEKIPASRLVAVADGIAGIAPLLWSRYQGEKIDVLALSSPKLDQAHRSQSSAIGSFPGPLCVDGDSVGEGISR